MRAAADATSPHDRVQLLRVEVAGQHCALPLGLVLEVHPAVQLTPLPDAPDVVIGLINRRGQPLPVMDLRRRLGLPTRPVQLEDRLVVLLLPTHTVALLVDAALEVLDLPAAALDEAAVRATQALRSRGVAVLSDGLVVVLEVAAFLSSDETATLEAALAHADLGATA